MLSVRLPVNGRLLVVKFLGSQKLYTDFRLCRGYGVGGSAPNPHIVPVSNVFDFTREI